VLPRCSACAFNLLLGYGGLLSFGHAAYFGMGAYVTGYASKAWGVPPNCHPMGGGDRRAARPALRVARDPPRRHLLRDDHPGAGPDGLLLLPAGAVHRGEDGIQAIPRGTLFGLFDLTADLTMYWVVAFVFLAGFLLVHRIVHSPFGQVLKATRDNEPRAISLGYRTNDYKLLAFVLSAALAGVAGGTKALVFNIATLTDVYWAMSGEVVLMSLVGGLGTVFGPVVGAAVIITMQNYLAEFGAWVTVIQGGIFIACVLAFRRGIVGEIGHALKVKL
jgi:branched-chain amino acid transport system permease protein